MKFEHTEVFNLEGAIRGMRNSWESHDKSDSRKHWDRYFVEERFHIGPEDHKLAMKLTKAGSGHDKFLRQILVSVDIIAPEYWWKEFDTYKVGTVANSTSMMHTLGKEVLHTGHFSFDDKENEDVLEYMALINRVRQKWIDSGKKKPSPEWRLMIQLMANSFLYKRAVTMNYGVLKTAYHQRRGHRLQEWHEFNKWIDSLPYSELITLKSGVIV